MPYYVGAARRDPDGSAIRLSLQRRVTVNTMTAGERIFVDFLPDGWTGPPPSLPAEVIRELAERARAAERALRAQLAAAAAKKKPPVRVRASVQPTFVRFVFEMPDGVSVSSVLNEQKLTLLFNSALAFDLADAKVAAPPNVASITQRTDVDYLGGRYPADRRSRRAFLPRGEELRHRRRLPASGKGCGDGHAPAAAHAAAPREVGDRPRQIAAAPVAHGRPLNEPMPLQQPAELPPVTSEAIAEQAKIEIKPGEAPAPTAPSRRRQPSEHAAPCRRSSCGKISAGAEKVTCGGENAGG